MFYWKLDNMHTNVYISFISYTHAHTVVLVYRVAQQQSAVLCFYYGTVDLFFFLKSFLLASAMMITGSILQAH